MPVDFKALFKDTTKYPDTMTFKLGDAEVTLGDLRQYDTAQGGALAKELEAQRKALAAEQAKLDTASANVAKAFIDVEAQRKALEGKVASAAANTDPLADYEKDAVFAPVVGYARQLEKKLADTTTDLTTKIDKLIKSQAEMGVTYVGDKARNDFATIPENDPVRPKDMTLDSLYKYTVESRIYDRNNLPDLKEGYKRLTADARHAHEIKEAEKRGEAKAREAQAEAALLPRPASGLPALPEGFKPPVNLGDAFSQASGDRDLWKQINAASVA